MAGPQPIRDDSAWGEPRYRALLDAAGLIVLYSTLPELFHQLAKRLRQVTPYDVVNFVLHEDGRHMMRMNIWENVTPEQSPVPIRLEIDDPASAHVWEHQEPLLIADLEAETRFSELLNVLRRRGLKSYCVLPMTTAQSRLGAIGFGSARADAYREADLEFMQRVANLVAVAVENLRTQQALVHDRDRLQVLLEVNNALVSHLELGELLPAITACVGRVIPFEHAHLALSQPDSDRMHVYALESAPGTKELKEELVLPAEGTLGWQALKARKAFILAPAEIAGLESRASLAEKLRGVRSVCCLPLITGKGELGTLNLFSSQQDAFGEQNLALLRQIADQVALAVENAAAYRRIAELAEEKLYLEEEIRTEYGFEEIIGESPALRQALAQADTVAPSDATVLVLGETGTGKERVARAIHNLSGRKSRNFIKVNCAAIPTGLLESELFGHERGAFTGAISQKIGRLELAHQGTLFLDEVGDIPPELQPKLLRVLQEHEFERLGSTRTIRVDVRLIAATNRDLEKMVSEGQFRSDLFYRLNVFPLRVPPLRERREDIALLVRYFAQRFAQRMDKEIDTIPAAAMNALVAWDWPGNVRELENIIERSVILSKGRVLNVPLAGLRAETLPGNGEAETLESAERKHIQRVLKETRGVLSGPRGAASRLGLKRTTLQARMRKLGITREGPE
ncbi:MAG: sigma 54-interacting transcriptional regulator [Terriglobales bacterium]